MPRTQLKMNLSHDEEVFVRQWMFNEVHFQHGIGPAKKLQLQHAVRPADLAEIIAAAFPDPAEQEAAGCTCPESPPIWPWTAQTFGSRLAEARHLLAQRRRGTAPDATPVQS